MIKLGRLTNEFTLKVIRCVIVAFSFLCLMTIANCDTRSAHQLIFSLGCIALFAFLVDNIWLTLFMWWTIFLYSYFGFNFGDEYITNIFYGAILYYLTKLAFKKEHIDFFLDGVLWLCVLNILYQIVQVSGFDFIYLGGGTPLGFMGNRGITTIFFALCVPILARRNMWLALLLFIPAVIAGSTMGLISCVIGYLWMLFFKIKRWQFILIVLALTAGSLFYTLNYKSDVGIKQRLNMWKLALTDANARPVTGWGLDSFRNFTEKKGHVYLMEGSKMNLWDNPHNLYISLFFEWGIIAIILLLGYLRQCGIWFIRAVRTPNLYALAGVLIVLFVSSAGWFPMFLARTVVLFVPCFALFEREAQL